MRRKDRELTEQAEILRLLARCDTVRLGLLGRHAPPTLCRCPSGWRRTLCSPSCIFTVPSKDTSWIAFCKAALSVSRRIFSIKVEPWRMGITARYESVVGFGTVVETSGKEKSLAFAHHLAHYGFASASPGPMQGAFPCERVQGHPPSADRQTQSAGRI